MLRQHLQEVVADAAVGPQDDFAIGGYQYNDGASGHDERWKEGSRQFQGFKSLMGALLAWAV